jgi:hypothetical protein
MYLKNIVLQTMGLQIEKTKNAREKWTTAK